ncbi:hypothetical protein D3C87_1818930 [compost metagenome]
MGILSMRNPQGRTEQGTHDQARGRFGVDHADRPFINQLLNAALSAADASVLARPLRRVAQHRWPVEEHDALDFRLQGHLDVSDGFIDEAVPGCARLFDNHR